ncbi:hypothetical protein Tco_1127806 [Tanacetum coccineum]
MNRTSHDGNPMKADWTESNQGLGFKSLERKIEGPDEGFNPPHTRNTTSTPILLDDKPEKDGLIGLLPAHEHELELVE